MRYDDIGFAASCRKPVSPSNTAARADVRDNPHGERLSESFDLTLVRGHPGFVAHHDSS